MRQRVILIINIVIMITTVFFITLYNIKSVSEIVKTQTIIIGLTGDVMLGRAVNEFLDIKRSFSYPWGNVLPLLKKNDLNIINLETTLTISEKKVPKVFNFKASPDKVECLKIANIGVVNLANNHILDFSVEGLIETIEVLNNAGIKHVGAGMNINEAKKPVIIEKDGIKLGILGYTDYEQNWKATEKKPGVNLIEIGDIKKIKDDILLLKKHVDFIIISIHWGPNMRQRPTEEFKKFAHQIIDSGVNIIHGHSAHIGQGIEVYNSGLILYDTGDFVDDYMVDPILRNDRSFLYLVELNKEKIKKVRLIPVIISNYQVNLAVGENYKETLKNMQNLSEEFSTKIDNEGFVKLNK